MIEINEDRIAIYDHHGEIVCWVEDEWKEDPTLTPVIANAVKLYFERGSLEMRKLLGKDIRQFTALCTYSDPYELEGSDGKELEVVTTWLKGYVRKTFKMSLEEFLSFYTWDHSATIYDIALKGGFIKEADKYVL